MFQVQYSKIQSWNLIAPESLGPLLGTIYRMFGLVMNCSVFQSTLMKISISKLSVSIAGWCDELHSMGWRAGWWDLAKCSSAVNCQATSIFFHLYSVLNLKTKTCWASGCFLLDPLGELSSCCLSVLLLYCTSRIPVQIHAPLPKSKLGDECSLGVASAAWIKPTSTSAIQNCGYCSCMYIKTNQR